MGKLDPTGYGCGGWAGAATKAVGAVPGSLVACGGVPRPWEAQAGRGCGLAVDGVTESLLFVTTMIIKS